MRPTRAAPVAIFLREDAGWLLQSAAATDELSDSARQVLESLVQRGASFLGELVHATRLLSSDVEDGLWELAAGGFVTADGFENLRALLDPRRRIRPRHATGRWALLPPSTVLAATGSERTESFGIQLLERWGIVFRDLLARETLAPGWRDLLVARFAGWKRVVRFAEDVSCLDLLANNSRVPKPSIFCGRCAGIPQLPD